ncbi:MAG: GerMN domain-containing protein [Clostridiales bacterium]|nr:GerMN domain-containing protein [Clostridiales bacterium]
MRRWILRMALLPFLMILLLSGCAKQEKIPARGEGVYQIYYLNSAMTRLSAQEYRTTTTDGERLIGELMECFQNVPPDVECQAALSEKVVFNGFRQENQVLYLYFDTNYTSMKADREILCRAALARTLTQIPGVDYINIYSGDQPLMDGNGTPIGMLSAADFVDSISDVNAFEMAELTLYFTDEAGELLYEEKRAVMHNINTSAERVVVEELIGGPEQEGLRATLDPSTRLLNISVNENICYLNFNEAFLNNSLEVKDYIPIYSIVNSLSELSTVNRVQITVNGSQDGVFRDTIPLSGMFERNLDYIGEK